MNQKTFCEYCGQETTQLEGRITPVHVEWGKKLDLRTDAHGEKEEVWLEEPKQTWEDCRDKDLKKSLIKEIKAFHETLKEWAGIFTIGKPKSDSEEEKPR